MTPSYEVLLYLDGRLIGNCRKIATNLKWTRRRTKVGADEIDFTVNDVLFEKWARRRSWSLSQLLLPIALECRIVRNGVEIVGGFLATMPGCSPQGTSANLEMKFDGFLNLLGGVYIKPIGTVSGAMSDLIVRFISQADDKAKAAGKAYDFVEGEIEELKSVDHTFNNYKSTKEWICDRCDNVEGAGPFDVYFHADKTYDIKSDANFGEVITNWVARYPQSTAGVSVASISAPEVSGFASAIIGLGSGEVSSDEYENTAISSIAIDSDAVKKYGYFENIIQESSISVQETLDQKVKSELSAASSIRWEPEITLLGKIVAPTPEGDIKIWIGDTINVRNDEDFTGMTSGKFRVNELAVSVSESNAETITPTLERVN